MTADAIVNNILGGIPVLIFSATLWISKATEAKEDKSRKSSEALRILDTCDKTKVDWEKSKRLWFNQLGTIKDGELNDSKKFVAALIEIGKVQDAITKLEKEVKASRKYIKDNSHKFT